MMKSCKSREEVLESIKKSSVLDEIDVYMLGLSIPLEREILRYIWSNQNLVNLQMLQIRFVYTLGVCTRKMLERRLESLVKFGFLARLDCNNSIFYEIKKEEEVIVPDTETQSITDTEEEKEE